MKTSAYAGRREEDPERIWDLQHILQRIAAVRQFEVSSGKKFPAGVFRRSVAMTRAGERSVLSDKRSCG